MQCSFDCAEFALPEEVQLEPIATPKPHEISTSFPLPLDLTPGPYNSLTQELQIHSHSRITVDLKPNFDLMQIMLDLLQWAEQDVKQMWVRPADHLDQPTYDTNSRSGLEVAIQDVLRKVACLHQISMK